jgi:hypothetical protein
LLTQAIKQAIIGISYYFSAIFVLNFTYFQTT